MQLATHDAAAYEMVYVNTLWTYTALATILSTPTINSASIICNYYPGADFLATLAQFTSVYLNAVCVTCQKIPDMLKCEIFATYAHLVTTAVA